MTEQLYVVPETILFRNFELLGAQQQARSLLLQNKTKQPVTAYVSLPFTSHFRIAASGIAASDGAPTPQTHSSPAHLSLVVQPGVPLKVLVELKVPEDSSLNYVQDTLVCCLGEIVLPVPIKAVRQSLDPAGGAQLQAIINALPFWPSSEELLASSKQYMQALNQRYGTQLHLPAGPGLASAAAAAAPGPPPAALRPHSQAASQAAQSTTTALAAGGSPALAGPSSSQATAAATIGTASAAAAAAPAASKQVPPASLPPESFSMTNSDSHHQEPVALSLAPTTIVSRPVVVQGRTAIVVPGRASGSGMQPVTAQAGGSGAAAQGQGATALARAASGGSLAGQQMAGLAFKLGPRYFDARGVDVTVQVLTDGSAWTVTDCDAVPAAASAAALGPSPGPGPLTTAASASSLSSRPSANGELSRGSSGSGSGAPPSATAGPALRPPSKPPTLGTSSSGRRLTSPPPGDATGPGFGLGPGPGLGPGSITGSAPGSVPGSAGSARSVGSAAGPLPPGPAYALGPAYAPPLSAPPPSATPEDDLLRQAALTAAMRELGLSNLPPPARPGSATPTSRPPLDMRLRPRSGGPGAGLVMGSLRGSAPSASTILGGGGGGGAAGDDSDLESDIEARLQRNIDMSMRGVGPGGAGPGSPGLGRQPLGGKPGTPPMAGTRSVPLAPLAPLPALKRIGSGAGSSSGNGRRPTTAESQAGYGGEDDEAGLEAKLQQQIDSQLGGGKAAAAGKAVKPVGTSGRGAGSGGPTAAPAPGLGRTSGTASASAPVRAPERRTLPATVGVAGATWVPGPGAKPTPGTKPGPPSKEQLRQMQDAWDAL